MAMTGLDALSNDIFEKAAVGFVVESMDGRILAANTAACRMLGRTRERIVGLSVADDSWRFVDGNGNLVARDDLPARIALRTGREVRDVILSAWNPTVAERRYLRCSAVPVLAPGDSPSYMACTTLVDATDFRRMEARVAEAEGSFNTLLAELPLGLHLFQLDAKGRLKFVGANRAANRILKIDHAELQGLPLLDAFPAFASTPVPAKYANLALKGGRWVALHEDYQGKQFRGAFEVHAFGYAPGHMAAVFQDITERKRTEQRLRDSIARLDMAVTASGIGTFEGNISSGRLSIDDRIAHMLGYLTGSDLEGLKREDLRKLVHPDDVERLMLSFEAHAQGTTPDVDCEVRMAKRRGGWRWVHLLARVLERDAEGAAKRWGGVMVDIDQRKQTEMARAAFQAKLLQTQKLESLGVLAGGIAHDFNNLLCAVMGASDLALVHLADDHPVREMLGQIQEMSNRAAELCRQLMAFSGKGRFLVVPTDVSALVQNMSQLLLMSVGKKAIVNFHLEPDLPAVSGDAMQLQQMVMNLVVNAAEAIGDRDGSITIRTGTLSSQVKDVHESFADADVPPGPYVFVEVADSGPGMDEDTRQRLFDPFFSTRAQGRGLGLTAVRGIVRGHRGTVQVRVDPGCGTTFRVLLPASDAMHVSEPLPQAADGWRGEGIALVVDDEAAVRAIAKVLLEHLGFEVLTAADGLEGVEIFEREHSRIRFVLLDTTMPNMDGEATLPELKRIRPDVRVLLTSGYDEREALSRFGEIGLAGFLQKPFTLEQLRDRVRAALEAGTAAR